MPRRRLIAAATAGALALVVLTGCRSDPTVAAYVGGVKITEAQVDKMITEVTREVAADNAAAGGKATQAGDADPTATPAQEKAPTRSDVVGVLVTNAVVDRVLHDKGLSATPPTASDIEQTAQNQLIPARSRFAAELANEQAGLVALLTQADPHFQPSDADLRTAYDNAVAAGVAPANDFNAIKPTFLQVQGFAQYVSVRADLVKSASQAGITVNPRYAPLEVSLMTLQAQTGETFVAVSLPLGKTSTADPAVVDIKPSPAATLPETAQQ